MITPSQLTQSYNSIATSANDMANKILPDLMTEVETIMVNQLDSHRFIKERTFIITKQRLFSQRVVNELCQYVAMGFIEKELKRSGWDFTILEKNDRNEIIIQIPTV